MIKAYFKDLSIRSKLVVIIMMTSAAALLVTAFGIMGDNLLSARRALVSDLSTLGRLIGTNSTAAIAFRDREGAREILGALRERPRLLEGALYTTDGEVFASYRRAGLSDRSPLPPPGPEWPVFGRNEVVLFEPIWLEGERLGTIYLRSDLQDLRSAIRRSMTIVAAVLAASLLLAFVISHVLQRTISRPIERLVGTAGIVSRERNYGVRAEPGGKDELGVLIEVFNDMLCQIQMQDSSLKQTVANLERSNRELEQFAHIASHDLQEPLRKVVIFGDRLRKKLGPLLDASSDDYLSRMQRSSLRMRQLIDDILRYSKVAREIGPFKDVSLNGVVREALEDIERAVRDSGAEVVVDSLPVIEGDELQLRLLFQNLMSNAVKYRAGSRRPRVLVSSRADAAGRVEISVSDNGIGFEEKYIDRIFKPFQRLHTQKEYPGTGMGLTICQKIVQLHGGEITARSRPGEGSEFVILLPRNRGAV